MYTLGGDDVWSRCSWSGVLLSGWGWVGWCGALGHIVWTLVLVGLGLGFLVFSMSVGSSAMQIDVWRLVER